MRVSFVKYELSTVLYVSGSNFVHSVEKLVLKSILVPVAVLVEDEDFTGRSITENHVSVEHVDLPHEGSAAII